MSSDAPNPYAPGYDIRDPKCGNVALRAATNKAFPPGAALVPRDFRDPTGGYLNGSGLERCHSCGRKILLIPNHLGRIVIRAAPLTD